MPSRRCNLLPGPASTQLAIYCARRVRGRAGAIVGGAAFILPGLVADHRPRRALPRDLATGLGARRRAPGAGAAVAAVAVHAGSGLVPGSWRNAHRAGRYRWVVYLAAGGVAAATLGPLLVAVLLGCGVVELSVQLAQRRGPSLSAFGPPVLLGAAVGTGGLASLVWVAFKVGALSYGGGFVIIPLMQSDAVHHYHWMTNSQFLNAVALGQITPGPVVQTVAVVGYAAAGVGGALLAAAVAFSPSFLFIVVGAHHFDRLREQRARAAPSSAAPDRRPSARSSGRPSHSPRPSANRGNSGSSPAREPSSSSPTEES